MPAGYRKLRRGLGFGILWVCCCLAGPALGANHALLVGVGNYAGMGDLYGLEGPPHDVAVLREVLIRHWDFAQGHIRVLVDDQAGRRSILAALQDLETATRPGDRILFYFSGHGTSAFDPVNRGLGIDPASGALIPADFRFDPDPDKMLAGLIVGSRDLRPLLLRLERERRVLAVFDTCFAGNTVRSRRMGQAPVRRSVDLDLGGDLFGDDIPAYGTATREPPPYPYTNVVYLSASSNLEVAEDISSANIREGFATIDNRPHGAFTDQFLRGLTGSADGNGDGVLTIRELFHYTRDAVSRRHNQTPGLLYNRAIAGLPDQPLFTSRNSAPAPVTGVTVAPYRLRLKGVPQGLAKHLGQLAGVVISTAAYDLLVEQAGGQVGLYASGGHPLVRLPADSPHTVVTRVRRQAALHTLFQTATQSRRPFNLFLNRLGPNTGVLLQGARVGFEIRSERHGYPLLVNLDAGGMINVIYPYYPQELRLHGTDTPLQLPEMGQVTAPFGMEHMLALWFTAPPAELNQLVGGEFAPTDPRFETLMKMIRAHQGRMATAVLQVKTAGTIEIRN